MSIVTSIETEKATLNYSDTEKFIKVDESLKHRKNEKKHRNIFGFACGIILLIATIISFSIYILSKPSKIKNNSDAIHIIEDLKKSNNSNITNILQNTTFKEAFKQFDTNGDGLLNLNEFKSFAIEIFADGKLWETYDIDNDNIISIRESIASIKAIYGNNNDINDELMANDMFFNEYDTNNKGYITNIEFINKVIINEFNLFDINNDNNVDINEFITILYGNNSNSWKNENNNNKIYYEMPKITLDMVNNIIINDCSIFLNNNKNDSDGLRRLQNKECRVECSYNYRGEWECRVVCSIRW